MDRWATKDHYERETEEADRLVRPAPKVKPPRRDLRREDMDVERDPDIDTDPDVARDPDLKMNFKDIGGSALNVLAAYLIRRADSGLIKVRHKDTGRVVEIKPETLKSSPDKYEEVGEEEGDKAPESPYEAFKKLPPGKIEKPGEETKEPPKDEKPPEKKPPPKEKEPEKEAPTKPSPGEKDDDFFMGAGRELYDAAESDLPLRGMLQGLRDPKTEIAQFAGAAPQMPVAPFLKGKKIPAGIETLGDLQKAALLGRKAPKKKPEKPKGEAPPKEEKKPEAPKPEPPKGEAPKEEKSEPKEEKKEPPKEKKPEEPKGEEPEGPEADAKAVVDRFLTEAKGKPELQQDWSKYVDGLPTTTRNSQGLPVWFDPKSGQELTFDKLPLDQRAELVGSFEKKHNADSYAALTAKNLEGNEKARAAIEALFDPESGVSKKLSKLQSEGHDLDALPVAKHLPELAKVLPEKVKTVGALRQIIEGHAELFQKKEPFQVWEKDQGPESPEFQAFAKKHGAGFDENGKPVFQSGKKLLPWDKLSDEEKSAVHAQFESADRLDKWQGDLTELARGNPDLSFALHQLGNPKSTIARQLAGVTSVTDKRLEKILPSLGSVALPPGMDFADLVSVARTAFKPVAPPDREPPDTEDVVAANMALTGTFQKHPQLLFRVETLGLHPQDISQVLNTYERLKTAKIKPEDLESRIKEAQKAGLYTSDPTAILPPKSGRDVKGRVKKWADLTPEEQSEAFAQHRNEVIATTFALRDQVANTFREMGIPSKVAGTLALAKLSHVPGESEKSRDERARHAAKRIVDSVLKSGSDVQKIDEENVKKTLEVMGDDPMARKFAIAYFQANDYLEARHNYLSPQSEEAIDERDHPRTIAARIRAASESLLKKQRRYPPEDRSGSMAEKLRSRLMNRLLALDPEKAAAVEPEIRKLDADEWDDQKKTFEAQTAKFKKSLKAYEQAKAKAEREYEADLKKQAEGKEPTYRNPAKPLKSVEERLREAKAREPIPPEPLPPKPDGYDLVRKTPRGQQQSGQSLWRRLLRGLTASERVVARFQYSSCAPGGAMGSNPTDRHASTERTGVYWGVDPNDPAQKAKVVNLPHTPWQQAHARDLSEKDYNAILAAAREWMKVPVLARVLDEGTTEGNQLGAARDIQFRAALDLAIRDLDGGKYAVGLHPTVYNNLLARLAGKSENETLLTQRAASGSLYTQATGEDRPMNAAAEIRKFAAEIAAQNPGLAFDLTNLAFRVAEQEGQQGQEQKEDKKPDFLKDKDAGAKYAALRGAVIKTAAANPAIRPALLPVLQMLKQG